jgi:hypothetical protein
MTPQQFLENNKKIRHEDSRFLLSLNKAILLKMFRLMELYAAYRIEQDREFKPVIKQGKKV